MIKFEDLVATKKRLDELLHEAGRDGDPFEIQAVCIDRFGVDGYREQFDAGVTDIIVVPWLFYGAGFDADLQTKQDGVRKFADEIMSKALS